MPMKKRLKKRLEGEIHPLQKRTSKTGNKDKVYILNDAGISKK